jgi:DNA-binding transcriptional MocR family regulator
MADSTSANYGKLVYSGAPTAAGLARLLRPRVDGPGPLQERLARAIREAVADGEVQGPGRLPAERELALALGLSRGTVVAAYGRLADEGLVERRRGSGTWLHDGEEARAVPSRGRSGVYGLSRREPDADRAPIDLSVAGPPVPEGVARALAAIGPDEVGRLGHGYGLLGVPALREAVIRHLGRWGLRASDAQVLVTSGAQQAIALLAALYVRPGDPVIVEDPTYVGALDAIVAAGGRPVPVPVDEAGLRPEALRAAARAEGAGLVYLVPTGQNPTGTVMPERRRAEVAAVIEELGMTAVEDGTLHDLTLRAVRPRTLAELAPRAEIITVGSLSKLVWGGLRLGWVHGTEELIERLGRLKLAMDHGSPGISQLVGARLLDDAEAQRERARAELAARVAAIGEAMAERLPDWRWRAPEAGLSFWVRLPGPEATGFARLARAMGVAVVAGPVVSVGSGFEEHLRLALVHEPAVLREAVRRLADAWAMYVPSSGASREADCVV